MEYVRTDRGILYVGDLIKDEYGNYCYKESLMYDKGRGVEINVNEILKQADTIEELCDAFVYVDTKHDIKEYKYMIRNSLCDNDLKYMKMGSEIKGAIWTDTGLIYVAKLNDKGELELL